MFAIICATSAVKSRSCSSPLCAVLIGVDAQLEFRAAARRRWPRVSSCRTCVTDAGDVLRDAIERGAMPIFVLFFAAVGASLHVEALATVGLVALGVAIARVALSVRRAHASARVWPGDPIPEVRRVWRGLMTTAGATLGPRCASSRPNIRRGARGWRRSSPRSSRSTSWSGRSCSARRWRKCARSAAPTGGLVVVSNREPWVHDFAPDGSIRARADPRRRRGGARRADARARRHLDRARRRQRRSRRRRRARHGRGPARRAGVPAASAVAVADRGGNGTTRASPTAHSGRCAIRRTCGRCSRRKTGRRIRRSIDASRDGRGRRAAGCVRVSQRLSPGAGRAGAAPAAAAAPHGALLAHPVARRRSPAHLSLAKGDR